MSRPVDVVIEAERQLLGAVLVDTESQHPTLLSEAARQLAAEDFFGESHRVIYRAMVELGANGEPVTITGIRRILSSDGSLKQARLTDLVPMSSETWALEVNAFRQQVSIIRDASVRRQLTTTVRVLEQQLASGGDIEQIADQLERSVHSSIAPLRKQRGRYRGYRKLHDIISDIVSEYKLPRGEKTPRLIPTGWQTLDEVIGGVPVGTLTTVCARPSIGKTAFCVSLALQWAELGLSVYYVVLEDLGESLARRAIACRSGVQSRELLRLISGEWSGVNADLAWQDLQPHFAALRKLDIGFEDTPGLTAQSLAMRCREQVTRSGANAIIVDHALEIRGAGKMSEYDRVTQAVEVCRDIAAELDVPVVLAAQIHRAGDDGGRRPPSLKNVKATGKFDEASRLALILHRPQAYDYGVQDKPHAFAVIAAKVTDGKTGTACMIFDPKRTQVREPKNTREDQDCAEMLYNLTQPKR
jgi:replicative DNA helicase